MSKKSLNLTYIISCLLLGFVILPNATSIAADFPEKSITYIIPFAVGGKSDLMARAIAPFVQERLGVPIKIENYPGVIKIGTGKLWKSKPDGYTIGSLGLPGPVTSELTSQTDYRSREFSYIYAWNESNILLQVQANGPKDMTELLRLAKSRTLTGATGSFASGSHLVSIVMVKGLGLNVRWVHYNSGGEANAALAGGHVDFNTVSVTPQTASMLKSGMLRALMIVADEKDPAFPDVPAPKDLGYSFKILSFIEGAVAPKGLPADRLSRLENAFADAAKDPMFKKWAEETKTRIIHLPPRAYSQKVAEMYSEVEKLKGELKTEK